MITLLAFTPRKTVLVRPRDRPTRQGAGAIDRRAWNHLSAAGLIALCAASGLVDRAVPVRSTWRTTRG